jgi:hypothetical protein
MASLCNHENESESKFTVPINQSKILIKKIQELHNEDVTCTLYFDAVPFGVEVLVSGSSVFVLPGLKGRASLLRQ